MAEEGEDGKKLKKEKIRKQNLECSVFREQHNVTWLRRKTPNMPFFFNFLNHTPHTKHLYQ